MTMEQRVEQLERRLKRTRGVLTAIVVAVIALSCIGQRKGAAPAVPEVITARSFRVVDVWGESRAELTVGRDNLPILSMADDKGKVRIQMGIVKDNSKPLLSSPWLRIFDAQNNARVMIGQGSDGAAGMQSLDSKGITRVWLMANDDGPLLGLSDNKDKPRVVLSVRKDNSCGLTFIDQLGTTRANLDTEKDGAPSFYLADPKGQLLFRAP